ncbi:hypothetical protein EW145_g722 [Phellinidium pouzarii]|uniref:ATP-dependent DNA helicase PIF1 n=1 Tax=Phellinidium pouzarii TaxID=167371 RepID=A0A4S4LHT0_9AGAM|nr:hypothetical protein EW145_g722 [Phellinidium pouzarii]
MLNTTTGALQSGLRTVKRDWSENDTRPASSSQLLVNQKDVSATAVIGDVSAKAKRMLAIQAALDEMNCTPVLKDSVVANTVAARAVQVYNSSDRSTSSSSVFSTKTESAKADASHRSKRPSDAESENIAKKKRVLPTSFTDSLPVQANNPPSSRVSSNNPSTMTVMNVTRRERSDKKAAEKPAAVFLSKEQVRILELVQLGHSIFYTGSAGTGKSVLLREIIKTLRKRYVSAPDAVAITASTGIAACNIGGVTVHSFSGIGLGVESVDQLTTKIRKNKKAMGRWLRTKVLIIDEVSMVDGDLFDKLSRIGSNLRKKPQPFGGIQVIVTGDFFQLPPVMKGGNPKFAFEADLWGDTIKQHTYNLTKVFRQKDEEFVDMLNEMRFGRLSTKSVSRFRSLTREIHYDDGLFATELFPRREDVDRANGTRMQHLAKEEQLFRAMDGGSITDPKQREKMLANFMAPSALLLKVDAQVMLIKNMDETLVNGSIGRVMRFMDPTQAKDEGVYPPGEDREKQKKPKSGQMWPVVAFPVQGGYVKEVMIVPETFKVELPNGEVQVSRTQIPLILAWAMSIHKSQGQTLERVKVDLGKVFEKGQAYVALSRATSLQGLQVLNFDASKVNAHPKVVEWSKTLQTIA